MMHLVSSWWPVLAGEFFALSKYPSKAEDSPIDFLHQLTMTCRESSLYDCVLESTMTQQSTLDGLYRVRSIRTEDNYELCFMEAERAVG